MNMQFDKNDHLAKKKKATIATGDFKSLGFCRVALFSLSVFLPGLPTPRIWKHILHFLGAMNF